MFLDLIAFAPLNKKGLQSPLSRDGRQGRLIPQAMLVPFQVVEITARTASTACLHGDGSKDKKQCVVSGGSVHFSICFVKTQTRSLLSILGWSGGLSWVS